MASPGESGPSLGAMVRRAVIWRSGSQAVAQIVQWAATFLVIRILSPGDYGLFAMCQVVLALLSLFNGSGLASGFVQAPAVTPREVRQLFGLLILANLAIAAAQLALAPLAAAYYREPAVAKLLSVQALLWLTAPFIVLPQALLARRMDFRHQARANLAAALASAATALGGALAGWGVWTLVAAPAALFVTRAAFLTWSARALVRPLFALRGAGAMVRFGGMVAVGQFFWFAQSQADVLIAGRRLSAHDLGLYTTALFLAQIFTAKVIPPLNEVAFSAYARIQADDEATARAFARAARVVMVAAMPFHLGLAAAAEPLVLTVLGAKWAEAVPVVRLLGIAMPFMTLQAMLTPACDARGRPGIGVVNGACGATILALAFAVGVRWGAIGLGWAWIGAYPLFLLVAAWRVLPVIGLSPRTLLAAIAPCSLAAIAMALGVAAIGRVLPPLPPPAELAALVAAGGAIYGAWLATFARETLADCVALVRGRGL